MSNQPDLEQLVKKFADGGWEALAGATDKTPADAKQRISKMQQVSEDVLWVARTPQGRRMIEWMFDNSLRRASWIATSQNSIEQIAPYGLMREGQNSMSAMVVTALRHATGGDISFLTQGESNDDTTRRGPGRIARFIARTKRRARRVARACRSAFRGLAGGGVTIG